MFSLFPVVISPMRMSCDCHESPMRVVVNTSILQYCTVRPIASGVLSDSSLIRHSPCWSFSIRQIMAVTSCCTKWPPWSAKVSLIRLDPHLFRQSVQLSRSMRRLVQQCRAKTVARWLPRDTDHDYDTLTSQLRTSTELRLWADLNLGGTHTTMAAVWRQYYDSSPVRS